MVDALDMEGRTRGETVVLDQGLDAREGGRNKQGRPQEAQVRTLDRPQEREVVLHPKVDSDLDSLPQRVQDTFHERVESLRKGERHPSTHPLNGPLKGWMGTSVGGTQYRMMHRYEGGELQVLSVGNHDEAYNQGKRRAVAMGQAGPDYDNLTFEHGEHPLYPKDSGFDTIFARHPEHGDVGRLTYRVMDHPAWTGYESPTVHVTMMHVDPEHQRRGVASQLMNHLENHVYKDTLIDHGDRRPEGNEWAKAHYNDAKGGKPNSSGEFGGGKSQFSRNGQPWNLDRKRPWRMPKRQAAEDYWMNHRPGGPGEGEEEETAAPAHALDRVYPSDVYTHMHYYDFGDHNTRRSRETRQLLHNIRGNPEAPVTIYRALPPEHADQGFRTGDWVSLHHDYAKQHGLHPTDPDKDWPVIKATVPAKHLWTNGDSLDEFGYHGPPTYEGCEDHASEQHHEIAKTAVDWEEYRLLQHAQDQRYERAGVGGGQEEYDRYYGTGEMRGAGTERRANPRDWITHSRSERLEDQPEEFQHHWKGYQLGHQHARNGGINEEELTREHAKTGHSDHFIDGYHEGLSEGFGESHVAKVVPHQRLFGPTYGLDRRLWGTDKRLKPDVRSFLIRKVGGFFLRHFGPTWLDWAKIYFAGSEASLWTGPDLVGNSDFDTLIGIDYQRMRKAVPEVARMTNQKITDLLNGMYRAELNNKAEMISVDGELTGPYDATFYTNPDSYDIRKIKPYAAFDVGANEWAVEPYDDPAWALEKFPKPVQKALSAAAAYARTVLRLPEPERTQQGAALFEAWHSDRSRAFGPRGEGWWDLGNAREKYLDQLGIWAQLVNCKHRADQGLDLAPADWSNTPKFAMGYAGPDYNNLSFKDMTMGQYGGNPKDPSHILFARHPDHGYVGRVHYDLPRDGKPLKVHNLTVNPEHQRRGVASQLMGELERMHHGQEIDHGVRTSDGTQWATRFYGDEGTPIGDGWSISQNTRNRKPVSVASMDIAMVRPSELASHRQRDDLDEPWNRRKIDDLKQSISEHGYVHGWGDPIRIAEGPDGPQVTNGNKRLKALRELGYDGPVPVRKSSALEGDIHARLAEIGHNEHPNVDHYQSGGMGHLEGDETRSVVGFVPTQKLFGYEGNETHDRDVVRKVRDDINSGKGITNPLMMIYDHKNKWAYLGEGNHRLEGAVEAGARTVPVRFVRGDTSRAKEEHVGGPMHLHTEFGHEDGYVPSDIHPYHFLQDNIKLAKIAMPWFDQDPEVKRPRPKSVKRAGFAGFVGDTQWARDFRDSDSEADKPDHIDDHLSHFVRAHSEHASTWDRHGEMGNIDLHQPVYATQSHVSQRHIDRYRKNPNAVSWAMHDDPDPVVADDYQGHYVPLFVTHRGRMHAIEGHHRIAAALQEGSGAIRGWHYNLDEHPVVTNSAGDGCPTCARHEAESHAEQRSVASLGRDYPLQFEAVSRVENLYGRGLDSLFPVDEDGPKPSTSSPWPQAPASKKRKTFDSDLVARSITHPHEFPVEQVDPRELHSTQPSVTRDGVKHYMEGGLDYGRSRGDNRLGNDIPRIYHRIDDDRKIILSGHHRAAAALLNGEPLKAMVVRGGWGAERN